MTFWNNRNLSEFEEKMRSDHKCICCGSKVSYSKYKKKDGTVVEYWPFECEPCNKSRTGLSYPTCGYSFGAARASVQHEFIRRIGGNLKDGN